jgi:hypothetical protein
MCEEPMQRRNRKSEGHRINHFITAMMACGCRFDSSEVPVFLKQGNLEFWEGEFRYQPAQISLKGKVTLDHDFITLKTMYDMSRKKFKKFREEVHLLLTTNQCHYYAEPHPEDEEMLTLNITKYIYSYEPPVEMMSVALNMVARSIRELTEARKNDFRDFRPKHPI